MAADPGEAVSATLTELARWGSACGWIGPDPYEGLNSPLGALAHGKRPRQAVIQLYKRTPVTPPWPLRATPRPNAKVFGLILSAYSTSVGRVLPGSEHFLSETVGQLETMSRDGAWGYHFDTQTRHLFYGREETNAIATCFVVGGLCDAHLAHGDERAAELALAARPYLLSLHRESPRFGPFFTYVLAGSELIHNANMMVSGALSRLHALEPDTGAAEAVKASTATTLALQADDGLWAYGEAGNLGWRDNFHTAYLLEGLCRAEAAFGIGGDELERGLAAWRSAFFEPDGWARYYPQQHFPLEPHCSASAIDLLCLLARHGRGRASIAEAERIADCAIRELWIPSAGRFAFRRTSRGLNRREFMRWTNAPMFRALCDLKSASARDQGG